MQLLELGYMGKQRRATATATNLDTDPSTKVNTDGDKRIHPLLLFAPAADVGNTRVQIVTHEEGLLFSGFEAPPEKRFFRFTASELLEEGEEGRLAHRSVHFLYRATDN